MMKIIIESHIPYIKGLLEPYAQVEYLEPEAFSPQKVSDADALIVRTRTRCDENLLSGTKVRFVGTATIGTDHINLDYCQRSDIAVASAPGCNAPAVAQYVLSCVGRFVSRNRMATSDCVIGIVGVGHIGKIIAKWAKTAGFKTLLCDPPRAIAEGDRGFVSLDEVKAKANVITFHTPLTKTGEYATYHICDADFVKSMSRCRLLINAARGAIFDTVAVSDVGDNVELVTDCWENEPDISSSLLAKSSLATPHIAGYSLQGKMRATSMIVKELASYFGLPVNVDALIDIPKTTLNPSLDRIMQSCDLSDISMRLKADSSRFEELRNTYKLRLEP